MRLFSFNESVEISKNSDSIVDNLKDDLSEEEGIIEAKLMTGAKKNYRF